MQTTTLMTDDTHSPGGVDLRPCLTVVHHADPRLVGVWRPLGLEAQVQLGRDSLSLGAGVLGDREISRAHALLTVLPDKSATIKDLGSRNGTFLNGTRVEESPVQPGDVLGLGTLLLLYHLAPAAFRIPSQGRLVGVSYGLSAVLDQIESVAPHATTVLIQGETGTGKELVAQEIHARSGVRGAYFAINCGGMPDSLLQSELFGCVRGAYSGADRDRQGLFEAAHGGTLLLDEIGDASDALQRAMLRVLQEGRVQRLGSTSSTPINTRVLAATHRDLASLVAAGMFREDLYARLAGWVLRIPPLRERKEDIPALVRHFLAGKGQPDRQVQRSFMLRLLCHSFPRNVRELARIVERALIEAGSAPLALTPGLEVMLRQSGTTAPADATSEVPGTTPPTPRAPLVTSEEDTRPRTGQKRSRPKSPLPAGELQALLDRHQGNVTHVAEELGIGRNTLYRWLKNAGVSVRGSRSR